MTTLTTLIPAYKKEYLAEVFLGLRRQSFRDFCVVLSDDSPGDEISGLVAGGHFGNLLDGLDLTVVRGPKNARLNTRSLLERWNGSSPLVHIHLDDDVVYPDFYRQHVDAHAAGRYSVSVSRRWYANNDTRPAYGNEPPAVVAASPLRVVPVEADVLLRTMIPTCDNWLGEFTNMVMTAASARLWPQAPVQGLNYYGWMDVGFALTVVQSAPLAFIRDHLSVFRQHAQQTTHHVQHHGGRVSSMAWAACALHAWREGRIDYAQCANAVMITVKECLRKFGEDDPVINRFFELVQAHGARLDALHDAFAPFWRALLASHPATAAQAAPAVESALA
jgi:hypothetical protein